MKKEGETMIIICTRDYVDTRGKIAKMMMRRKKQTRRIYVLIGLMNFRLTS